MKRLIFGLLLLSLVGFSLAVTSEASYCCEKTTSGAWCVNDDESACSDSFNSAPTSCETTSYCKLGTCYDSEEGICMGNTPQRVCNENGGTWDERDVEDVPQCQLGCCLISDQAAFVTLVRCKELSTYFGIENIYRTDITSEIECIAEAQAQDMGACVYEKDYERLCEFTTRGECDASDTVEVLNQTNLTISTEKTFYEDYLCSAEELGTSCARQADTTCYEGDVYWVDSCGNRENVYSSDKDKGWNNGRVLEADEVCSANDGSKINCGNCDYLLGSRCAEYDGFTGGPSSGDYYCQKTECVDRDGNKRLNGESWCVGGSNNAGGRYYREICDDGEVRVEACADYRNEICIEDSVETSSGEFGVAACRVNRWQDCTFQTSASDCANQDQRDCKWVGTVAGLVLGATSSDGPGTGSSYTYSNPTSSGESDTAFTNPTANVVAPITGNFVFGGGDSSSGTETGETTTNRPNGVCVPNFSPGLAFWEDGSADDICGQLSAKCVIVYEKGLVSGEKVVKGQECLDASWVSNLNAICTSLGDCGSSVNYVGKYVGGGYSYTKS